MKIPKKIIIAGKRWVVKTNKRTNGASVEGSKGKITVGIKDKVFVVENFLHEVIEGILMERGHRYHNICGQQDCLLYLFSFNHDQFAQLIKDIEIALKDVIK